MNCLRYTHFAITWFLFAIVTVLLTHSASTLAAERYEEPPVLNASVILSKELVGGSNHQVDDSVINDGYMNTYRIQSKYPTFTAPSTELLRIRIDEINAIAVMENLEEAKEFGESAQSAGGNLGKAFQNLVEQPEETLKGAGTGIKRMFDRAGETFRSQRSASEDSAYKDLIGFSKVKREYAAEFGVDAYSSNALLQEHLNRVAWSGYAGGIGVAALVAMIPGGAGMVVTATSSTRLLNDLVKTTPPTELRKLNRKKLIKMGVSKDIAKLFINNDVFSPRHQTFLVGALEGMEGVEDRTEYISFAIPTNTGELALFRQRMAEMYNGFHQNIKPIKRFIGFDRFVAAQSADNKFILAVPLDYLVWTQSIADIVGSFDEYASSLKDIRGKELWIAGSISPLAADSLERRGWAVAANKESELLSSQ